MADALVNYPGFGSLWLTDCYIENGYVIGQTWDESGVGSPYMPDDFMGEPITMNFPVSCIRKRDGDIPERPPVSEGDPQP